MGVTAIQRSDFCSQVKETSLLPFRCVANTVKWFAQKFFGFFLRIAVFQLGEYNRIIPYYIMRAFQLLNCDPRERRPVNRARLEESKSLLYAIGGVEGVVYPADGNAKVRYMKFRSDEAFQQIAKMGGEARQIYWKDLDGKPEIRQAIFPAKNTSKQDFNRLCDILSKFSLEIANRVEDMDGNSSKAIILPYKVQPDDDQPPCILRCHSPGRSMVMDRLQLRWLFAGCDVYIFDPRGTIDSTGIPSEGGEYLDTDAVFKKIVEDGYPPHKIYASGYCKGAAMAAWLVKQYPEVHYIAENPFNSLRDMIRCKNFIGKLTADCAMSEIQSKDRKIVSIVEQDGFDTEGKFRKLKPSSRKFILVHTDTDKTNPKHSIPRLVKAIGKAGEVFVHKRIHPDRKKDGHMQPPSEGEKTWRWMADLIK